MSSFDRFGLALTPSLLVGVIGHPGHGKTALVRALTGTDADCLGKEAHVVPIGPAFAVLRPADAETGAIGFMDRPDDEHPAKAISPGAAGMRAVLLVIAANAGIDPRTMQHPDIVRLIGERRCVIALTKCDLVGCETVAERRAELMAAANRAGITPPVVATSAVAETGITELRTVLGSLMQEVSASSADPSRQETEHVQILEAAFRQGALSPPDEAAVVGRDIRRREALRHLLAAGTLIRALDRVQKRSILFHRDAIATGKARLAESFPAAADPESGFLTKEAGAALGISRKFSIPLLEYLDAIRFTRRVGDRRIFLSGEN